MGIVIVAALVVFFLLPPITPPERREAGPAQDPADALVKEEVALYGDEAADEYVQAAQPAEEDPRP